MFTNWKQKYLIACAERDDLENKLRICQRNLEKINIPFGDGTMNEIQLQYHAKLRELYEKQEDKCLSKKEFAKKKAFLDKDPAKYIIKHARKIKNNSTSKVIGQAAVVFLDYDKDVTDNLINTKEGKKNAKKRHTKKS